MQIEDFTHICPVLDWAPDGSPAFAEENIIFEYRLRVAVNDVVCMEIICTPLDLRELVVGRLFTEGFIDSVDDVESFELAPEGLCSVSIRGYDKVKPAEIIEVPTTGDSSRIFGRFSNRKQREDYLTVGQYAPWEADDIFELARKFSEDSPLHKHTRGTHSCYLWYKGNVEYIAEDLGRHNTVDKAIGYALLRRIDLSLTKLFISGRVPTDMMIKAIRAKFNVFASKEMPTQDAILLARKYRATLVCGVRGNHLKVFSGMQPTVCE